VLDDVGQRLLDDPEGGKVDPGRHGRPRPVDPNVDLHTGTPHVVHQRGKVVEAGGRAEGARLGAVAGPEHAEEATHLAQGGAGGGLDGLQGPLGGGGIPGGHHPPRAGMHRHHAHAVGHHVVQLSGDPQPFLGDGPAGQLVLGRLQLAVLRLQLLGVAPAGADSVAEEPRAGDDQRYARVRRTGAQRGPEGGDEDRGHEQPAAGPLGEPGGCGVDAEHDHRAQRRRV
jgi:hypothetical protein